MNGLESMIAYGGVAVAYAAALVLIAVRGRPGHRARMARVSGPLSPPNGAAEPPAGSDPTPVRR